MSFEARIQVCLEENGIEVDEDGTIHGVDSFGYISTIVSLENEFSIEFPDEYLNVELMTSLERFTEIARLIIQQKA